MYVGPVLAELSTFVCSPAAQDVIWVVWRAIQIGPAKIKQKGTTDDGHLNCQEFVVVVDKLRYVVPQNDGNIMVTQTVVGVALTAVSRHAMMELYRQWIAFSWPRRKIYAALDSTSKASQAPSSRGRLVQNHALLQRVG